MDSFNNVDGHLLAILQMTYAAYNTHALAPNQLRYLEALETAVKAGRLEEWLTTATDYTPVVKPLSRKQRAYWVKWFSTRGGTVLRKQWIVELLTDETSESLWECAQRLLERLELFDFRGIYSVR